MPDWQEYAFQWGLSFIGFWLAMRLMLRLSKGQPMSLSSEGGRLRTKRSILIFAAVLCGVTVLASIYLVMLGIQYQDGLTSALGVAMVFCFGLFTVISFYSLGERFHLVWTQQWVEGPKHAGFRSYLGERSRLLWTDVHRHERYTRDFLYLESRDGKRVYWNRFYEGYEAFEDAIKRYAPYV